MKCILVFVVYLLGNTFGSQTFMNQELNKAEEGDKRSRQRKQQKTDKWLVDSIFYDDYQSDAPSMMTSQDVCPPFREIESGEKCADADCSSDLDCQDDFRCCFTGCAFRCVPEVKPAAVVDWIREPRRSRSGISWLIDGPIKTAGEEETCSTSPVGEDEDPLLCPHGYFCHVTYPGKPKKGIPNSGYCVKQADQQISPGEEEMVLSAALQGRKTCTVDNIVLLDGARIRMKKKNCRCKKGNLSCGRNKRKPDAKVEIKVKAKKTKRKKKDKNNGKT